MKEGLNILCFVGGIFMPEKSSIAKSTPHFYWELFKSTFLISAFTVGGGFVIIPLLRAKYVDEYGWLDDKETLNLVSIAQSMPGVVACNSAIILGYRMAGLMGTMVALLATVLPPLITISVICCFYEIFADNEYVRYALKGMQCGATAIIINVAYDLLRKQLKKKLALPVAIILVTFVANYCFDVNLMLLVVLDGLVGLMLMRGEKYC